MFLRVNHADFNGQWVVLTFYSLCVSLKYDPQINYPVPPVKPGRGEDKIVLKAEFENHFWGCPNSPPIAG